MNPTPRKERSNPDLAPEKKLGFLAVLAECCNVGKACKAVSISRTTAYDWRERDEAFAAAWDKAMKIGVSALEDEAHRRGFEGVDEPVFQQGMEIGTVRKYSDTLAIFLLKAHDPDKYRENSKVELNGRLAIGDMSEDEIRAELSALVVAGVVPTGAPDDGSDLV
jgi:hypothetical protein